MKTKFKKGQVVAVKDTQHNEFPQAFGVVYLVARNEEISVRFQDGDDITYPSGDLRRLTNREAGR
jgi:hypothetical protein